MDRPILELRDRQLPAFNRLLAALPPEVFARLQPHLELVPMPLGQSVCESGARPDYVYFPTTSIVSLLFIMEGGSSAQIALVGNDGVVGIALFMGGNTTPSRAMVQSMGEAYRLSASLMKAEFDHGGEFMLLLLRYTQALTMQMAQTAVCSWHHSVQQQLCRLVLLSLDRLPSNELVITQELMSSMLGVRRERVTEAAGRLQDAGVIRYGRGHLAVLDRSKLEARACECYSVVRRETDRLFPARAAPEASLTVNDQRLDFVRAIPANQD